MIPLHIGFSGTRYGMTLEQRRAVYRVFRWYRDNRSAITVHHGSCVGADAEAHDIARILGIPVSLHPPIFQSKMAQCAMLPDEKVWPARDYLVRNRVIVDVTAILVAAPKEEHGETLRGGTWSTVRYARALGREGWIVRPSGIVEPLT